MNILGAIRISTAHQSLGGMEQVSHDLYKRLAAKGHSITVLTSAFENDQKNEALSVVDNVRYISLPTSDPGRYSDSYHNLVKEYFLRESRNIELVHSASAGGGSLASNTQGIPVVATWHGTFIEEELDKVFKYQHIDRKNIDASHFESFLVDNIFPKLNAGIFQSITSYDYHVVISNYMKKVISCYGPRKDRIEIIHNGVAGNFFYKPAPGKVKAKKIFGINEHKICIGLVGRMGLEKGLGILDGLVELIDPQKYCLFFVGDSVDINRYIELGFDTVQIRMDHHDMHRAYHAMDVFLNPTLRLSGLDMTVQEAIVCNTPVLLSDLPQYKMFERDVSSGCVTFFKTGSVKDLMTKLELIKFPLISNIDNINSLDGMADEYESLFLRIIKNAN